VTALDLVFLIFGLLFVTALFFGFFYHFSQASKDQAVKREIALRFYPDEQGNYPKAIFTDGTFIEFQTGNSRHLAAPHYIIQPTKSEVISALPARSEPLQKVYGREVVEVDQPEVLESKDEVIAYLIEAKSKNVSMTSALKGLGITGGETFKAYAKKWKALP
jgi:hypothetical protein